MVNDNEVRSYSFVTCEDCGFRSNEPDDFSIMVTGMLCQWCYNKVVQQGKEADKAERLAYAINVDYLD